MQASNNNAYASERPPALCPQSILVVEDDDDLRTQLAALLRDDGYAVTEAIDGLQGLSMLRAAPVDVVLLDLWLPRMDGWAFRVKQLAEEKLRDIPVVVMTADDRSQARAIDADAILGKPFESDDLFTTIRRVLTDRSGKVHAITERVSDAVALVVNATGHEIANPLMGLIYSLEQSRVHPNEANIDQLLEECWRIANCLRVLRDLPCPSWSREIEVDFESIVRSALSRANTDGARVILEADGPAWVRGDPLVIRYLCTALLSNAIEAVPASRRSGRSNGVDDVDVLVQLRGSPTATEVIFDVRDFGAAIPDDDLRRLFTAGGVGRGRAWGAGLRLSFVRESIERLGGAIEIANVPDGGVLCRVRLPSSTGKTPVRASARPSSQ